MISSDLSMNNLLKPIFLLLAFFVVASVSVSEIKAEIVIERSGKLGVIKGVVRDEAGNPIAKATVLFSRGKKILKQVTSSSKGTFFAKLFPGTYKVLAVAEGFNPVTYSQVEVNTSAELVYKFNLERSGSGNTLPEKRADRKSTKYTIRAAQNRRSIYQNTEGESPIDENAVADADSATDQNIEIPVAEEPKSRRRGQTVVETYVASTDEETFEGLNFATLLPVNENTEIIFAGQTGTGDSAPNRFEANLKFRPNEKHQLRLKGSIANLGNVLINNQEEKLGQVSLQVLDEWRVREGIVLVYGFDYSRFIGAGDDYSVSPRLGFQFDVNSKTRFRTAYTATSEEPTWQRAIELENTQVLFREPVAVQEFVVEDEQPKMQKSRRLEFGIERVLDNRSSVEANVFFDAVSGRGVGLVNLPFEGLDGESFDEFVGNQQGKARGVRVVYTRRLNGTFSTSAGYSFGNGQKLSNEVFSTPENAFEEVYFQTFIGQFDADLNTGTNVTTIFRFSPQATVFAIDPFQGRMAIYDPGLSVLVTQSLPNLGLPIRAEAILDARNLLDFQPNVNGEEGILKLNSQRRVLRGGISVRF
jgi:hypothetical protein